ncbi:hypothetical protein AB0I27_21125 [Streptomyces sp. NPDC050597]|jgi:hypothetical protein|uniref:hypothetical protein n=1 Tax=Streptomyces sp. NPDC050597 TaxID=3157212 RepID=UPI0034342040
MERSPSEVPAVFDDEAVDLALAKWLHANHAELSEPEPLETGGSGGKLVSAFVSWRDPKQTEGRMIIKLVARSREAAAEPRNHSSALLSRVLGNGKFIDEHLVELADKPWPVGDAWLMFQRPAGDGKEETGTLAGLGRPQRLPEIAKAIVKGVLGQWNPRVAKVDTMSAAQFVTDLLGRRLGTDEPLRTWARDRLGPAAESLPWFTLPGGDHSVPNPLFLADDCPIGQHKVRYTAKGRAHGDLHPGNIMVPVREDASAEDFTLIDLSGFDEKALLARDPVHLLLCLMADAFLPHMSEDARGELISGLIGSRCDGPLIPQGLADTVDGVRDAMLNWGAELRIEPRLLRQQWWLALQACALMVTARERYADGVRWWFFRLAAEACGAFSDDMRVNRPRDTPVLNLLPDLEAVNPSPVAARTAPVAAVAAPTAAEMPAPPAVDGIMKNSTTADTGPLQKLLREIQRTFQYPLETLTLAHIGAVPPGQVEFVRSEALSLRLVLRKDLFPALQSTEFSQVLIQIGNLLQNVADKASSLHGIISKGRIIRRTASSPDEARGALVNALEELLDTTRELSFSLSPATS